MVFLPNLIVMLKKDTECDFQAGRRNPLRYPWNINHMPPVIFSACLDLEQKSLFMDGH
jgi:hypothetical protein